MSSCEFVALGDKAITVRLGEKIDPKTNERALALKGVLDKKASRLMVDEVVCSYSSVSIYFKNFNFDYEHIKKEVLEGLHQIDNEGLTETQYLGKGVVEIPVSYDGPDLEVVAKWSGLYVDEVIRLHQARVYRVFAIGFRPGFPFMGVVDSKIAKPRLDSPRLSVPSGSVGIAGLQTGIYPTSSPGGWNLVGKTKFKTFCSKTNTPKLSVGQRIKFVNLRSKSD